MARAVFGISLFLITAAVVAAVFAQRPQPVRALATSPASSASATRPSRAVNPHRSPDGCRNCHVMKDNGAQPIARSAIDTMCLDCHDGRRASRELHPIGRRVSGEQASIPEGWPVPGGKLGCVTCHDIRKHCRQSADPSLAGDAFLRGDRVRDPVLFCAYCHQPDAQRRPYSPHLMLASDNTVNKNACQFCHQPSVDERNHWDRIGQPDLRMDELTICLSCHRTHVDYFEPGHIGARLTPKMVAFRAEAARSGRATSGEAIEASQFPLPLAAGVVVCSTCHNPHQAGVFPAGTVLAAGARSKSPRRDPLPLRGFGKELCSVCHTK